ncbi:ribosomal protein L35Ae-domain-containing protein [Nemania serpens]|nr:ribosomal protein L35Ae-domain-containing protein [Nemania serpens]
MPSEAGHRLYVKARHLGYRQNKHTTHPNRSLVKIEGVDDTDAANFYLGKKIAFIHKAPKEIRGTQTHLGQGRPTSRQLRRCAGSLLYSSPHQIFWRQP